MSRRLLGTDILSEIIKGKNPVVAARAEAVAPMECASEETSSSPSVEVVPIVDRVEVVV